MGPAHYLHTFEGCSTFMKRDCSASVWLLLVLVVALFCLSALAPREWSEWDSRPLGHSAQPRRVPVHVAVERYSRPPIQPRQPQLVAMVRPESTETESAPACPEIPKPDLAPLPTDTVAPAENALDSHPVSAGIEPSGPLTFEAAFSQGDDNPAVACTADRWRGTCSAAEIERSSDEPAAICDRPVPDAPNGEDSRAAASLARDAGRPVEDGPVRQMPSATMGPLRHWPYPAELASRLRVLARDAACAGWCEEVLQRLERVSSVESLAAVEIDTLLAELRRLVEEGLKRANRIADRAVRSQWTRTALALKRRLDIWEQVHAIASATPAAVATAGASHDLRRAYDALAARLRSDPHCEMWRQYLLMSEAQGQFFSGLATDTVACRELAKRILLRTDYSVLTPKQVEFLQEVACAEYLRQLQRLATEPVDYLRLLAELERYEQERSVGAALHVAAAQQVLRWSDVAAIAELGRRIDSNYRNANLRVTVSQSFLERMLPPPEPVAERVEEVIQGAYTTGCSETLTELGVCLLPSLDSWRIGLVAKGQVAMETQSDAGAATFYRRGNSSFRAAKEVVIHRFGWYHRAAVANAQSSSELADVTTKLDPVPLLGDLARVIAAERFRTENPRAEREVKQRVTATASDRIDTEVSVRLNELQKRFGEHFYAPLQQLALNPLVVDMRTTDTCLVGRYRLAGHDQLGAHTPRGIAPASSVFQFQVHESTLNNLFERLGWEGRRENVRQLYRELADRFKFDDAELPDDLPDDIFVRFADEAPVRVDFQEDRLTLQLALAELSQGLNRWRNFTVRVHYRRLPDRTDAVLARDQYVELIGKRLHLREQIALRGIFSRVFSQSQPIELVGQRLQTDARLSGLEVDQFEIRDGWLSVSLGQPAKPAERTARQPNPLETSDLRTSRPAGEHDGQRAIMIRLRSP